MQAQPPRRLFRNDGDAGACVEDETERLFASVDADVDDRAIVRHLEGDARLARATDFIKTALVAEIAQEINQPANPRATVFIRFGRDDQETLVSIGSLFVTLG